MKLILTLLAATGLALSALLAAPVPANAYDPSATQNWSREAQRRWETYNNIRPYDYNGNSGRRRANYGRARPKRAPYVQKGPSYSPNGTNTKGRDCTPINGPYGYYSNPWCDGGF